MILLLHNYYNSASNGVPPLIWLHASSTIPYFLFIQQFICNLHVVGLHNYCFNAIYLFIILVATCSYQRSYVFTYCRAEVCIIDELDGEQQEWSVLCSCAPYASDLVWFKVLIPWSSVILILCIIKVQEMSVWRIWRRLMVWRMEDFCFVILL